MNSELFSIGTKTLVEKLQEEIMNREYPIDTLFVNMGTFIRNCVSNEKVKEAIEFDKKRGIETDNPSRILVEEAKTEMINFIQFACQSLNNASVVNPKVVSYHVNYAKHIPRELFREPPPSKRVITLADEMVRGKLIVGNRKETKEGKVDLVEFPMNGMDLSWKLLMNELRYTKNQHFVAMVSSHPLDFHVGQVCRTFRVIRSYTGEVVWYKKLGNIVFDKKDILPFNIYTHAVLGDKEDLKTLLSPSAKKNLYNIAQDEEWILKTQEYIRERLFKLNVRIPIKL